ncbi:PIF1 helicase-like protein, partial [Angomonas deanei]
MLSKPFRQRDADFFKLLNQMRLEKLDDHSVAVLKRMSTSSSISFVSPMQGKGGTDIFTNELGEVESEEFQGYTCLRPRNKDVAWVNMLYYNKLKTTEYTYVTHISTGRPNVTGVPFLDPLSLREGCRVMLIKNINVSLGLVNGSVGVITKFINYKQNGYTVKSYPNYLSHICKGVDNHFNRTHTMLPVVLFSIYRSDGSKTECEIVVEPQEWEELLGDRVQSRYSQIPLVLAYALTIHKAQGMSLNKVDIDFNGTFEAGQAYVALSRCTNLTTVKLHNFMVSVAFQDEVALSYYKAAEACIENNRNETHSSPKRLNRQIEDLRQRVPELEEQARALSSLIRSRSTPMHQLKEAKVVFDITALYEIGVKGPDRFDPLFQQDNMIRVPLVVMEMLQSIREQMGDDTQEEEEEEENDDNDSTDSSGASVSTIKQMIDFIEKGKQAFVVDFQRAGGEGRSQVCEELPPPLPEYAKYRDLLPLVETDEDRDENVFALNLLSNDP